MLLVVAEKPSVGRDLARVLGARPVGRSQYEGAGYVITWCVGHLVELDEPQAYDARWKQWRMDTLPMLPTEFKLRPSRQGEDQLRVVVALLKDRRFEAVVNACDAGREGELIFRYVYQYADSRLPMRRLWISSLTDDAIRTGFAALKPGAQYDALSDAARSRSEADWLVGLNATRAITLRARQRGGESLLSIGRVQTPTLAMLVARDRAIARFVPRDYWEVAAKLTTAEQQTFSARWHHGRVTQLDLAPVADAIVGRCDAHHAAIDPRGPRVVKVRSKTVREPPPQLFDLTSLQRTANRRYGFSAQRTLDLAQALYERHKVLSYPRTDSRYLSTDVAKELPKLFAALATVPAYASFAQPLLNRAPTVSKRVVDDNKVQDHHAIIPTTSLQRVGGLDRDEERIFDMVARRFLGVFYPDAEFAVTTAQICVGSDDKALRVPETDAHAGAPGANATATATDEDEKSKQWSGEQPPPAPDWFLARGRVRVHQGWQTVAGIGDSDTERKPGETDEPLLPPLVEGQRLDGAFESQRKQTLPPRPYTEATLLSAMESAGKTLDDEELRAAMKDTGLGTPATRASIIETLIKREYVVRDKKQLLATAAGRGLIDALPVHSLASPELTGEWEARLARIARKQETRAQFMADIGRFVAESISAIRGAAMPSPPPAPPRGAATPRPAAAPQPAPSPTARAKATPKGAPKSPSKSPKKPKTAPKTPRKAKTSPAASVAPPQSVTARELICPRCGRGKLITGKRGWGCDRWREGCHFVIWFETNGRRLTELELRHLVIAGQTGDGKLALDPSAEGGVRATTETTSKQRPPSASKRRVPGDKARRD